MRYEKPSFLDKEEDSSHEYDALASKLSFILGEAFDYEVPAEALARWSELSSSMRGLDNLIDTSNSETRIQIDSDIRSVLDNEDLKGCPESLWTEKESVEGIQEIRAQLTGDQKAFFDRAVKVLLKTTEEIKRAVDVKKVAQITLLEGQITAKLYIALLPESFRQEKSSKEIYDLLSSIGRVGNVFDTALDLPRDFEQGQVSILPSSFNRAYFVGRAMSECIRMKKQGVLTLPNIRALLGATVGVYKTRNKNMGRKDDEG